jgi:hypothetical protein
MKLAGICCLIPALFVVAIGGCGTSRAESESITGCRPRHLVGLGLIGMVFLILEWALALAVMLVFVFAKYSGMACSLPSCVSPTGKWLASKRCPAGYDRGFLA